MNGKNQKLYVAKFSQRKFSNDSILNKWFWWIVINRRVLFFDHGFESVKIHWLSTYISVSSQSTICYNFYDQDSLKNKNSLLTWYRKSVSLHHEKNIYTLLLQFALSFTFVNAQNISYNFSCMETDHASAFINAASRLEQSMIKKYDKKLWAISNTRWGYKAGVQL